jgi:hypothetical protein
MARQADVVIVVGGRSSNNTRELVQTCARYCARVHHVQTDADLRPEWFDAAKVVGLTAGTSTPDEVIDRVEARIRLCADASASARASADKSPGQVRQVDAQTRIVEGVAMGKRAPACKPKGPNASSGDRSDDGVASERRREAAGGGRERAVRPNASSAERSDG